MAQNTIHIEFDPCDPFPAAGYVVRYRPLGSGGAYRTAPSNFLISPIEFVDNLDPVGTSYEGFIQGDCGGGKLGVSVPWVAEFTGSVPGSSEAPSGSGAPEVCDGVCGRYEATGEAPGGAAFTWRDCDGIYNDTVIPFNEVFEFCTCDTDPEYTTANVTVLRVGSCNDFNEVTIRHSNSEVALCGETPVAVFILAPATSIAPGVTVYGSEDVMDPILGSLFIDQPPGAIYNLGPGTGTVGALTGNSC